MLMPASADDWWRRAESELAQARVLKDAGHTDGAYFHAGQSIEFGLKALYLKRNGLAFMPDDHKGAHWHDLQVCAEAARLKSDLNQRGTSGSLKANWYTVRDWRSNARFPDVKVARQEMVDLFVAVCNGRDGVWQWLEIIYRSA